jgi:endonuclease/exonuclease/phosphatase (EEP) superfamily protein YafD
VVGAILAAALAAFVTVVDGVVAIGLVITLQALATGLVGLALRDGRPGDTPGRIVWSSLAASLSFAFLTFLWLIDIDAPLPFPRVLVPASAVALLGVAASRSSARTASTSGGLPAFGLAAIVGVAAVSLSAWLWFDRPADDVQPLEGDLLRIVQYNVRGALNTDGELDPDAVARAIASSNPDVVVLQEVARGWPVFGAGDLLARLEQRLNMPSRFEPAADGQLATRSLRLR